MDRCSQILLFVAVISATFVILFATLRFFVELIQMISSFYIDIIVNKKPPQYFFPLVNNFENYIELIAYTLSIVIGIAVLSSGNGCLSPNMYNVGILVVTLGWTNLIFFLSKLPIAGVYALTFISIVMTFLKLALFGIFLLLGSTVILLLIFSNPLHPVS